MNPFTRFLNQWTKDQPDLSEFIGHWDTLEALAIQVYKKGKVSVEDAQNYQNSKLYMQANYEKFSAQLTPFWKQSEVGGTIDHADPFEYLFQYETADQFVGNWAVLQHLPAAREALNGYLVQIESS